ncbi:MAG TPA: phosphatidylserine/phosphatidylglycerophosphate/cardiolipin synthase family protein [Kiritimatiellia bacterium]|nr:phosphatidylserine/phosphatidylglycerophosphate/cardiolipin synthase family protein [Kiritimatiellia bacterium]HOU58496.1 phosphatidylserine/phosphatidylglycerophosphate/cardiolipin synthase family protein [Kiritimatiellia bacterium]HPK68900.1 phosphatidylserine/phosphatidylglycerophosphate/cardiolipin synthase family protein [Kiritimatiellia bacterium]
MLRRFRVIGLMLAVLAAAVLPGAASLFQIDVDPFYADTLLKGKFGDVPVYFFLGPSPTMEKAVVAFIGAATQTLDVCVYDLNLPEFAQALLDARARGVKVRVIVAQENAEKAYAISGQLAQMEKLGMLTLAHNRSGLMHNKFMVADKRLVWTGSYNLTRNCSRFNDNHAIVLESKELAENYSLEWLEIFEKRHGKRFAYPTPHPEVNVGGVLIHNYFTPEDDTRGGIVAEMDKATNEIAILAFSFTDAAMTEAVKRAIGRGVRTIIVLDSGMATHPSANTRQLEAMGANVRMSPGVLLHHKVIVIDRQTVVLGSANFSQAAFDKNDENVLIVKAPNFAQAMLREAMRCWRAEPYWITKWRTQLPASP